MTADPGAVLFWRESGTTGSGPLTTMLSSGGCLAPRDEEDSS
jgi:hypothetical protein